MITAGDSGKISREVGYQLGTHEPLGPVCALGERSDKMPAQWVGTDTGKRKLDRGDHSLSASEAFGLCANGFDDARRGPRDDNIADLGFAPA